MKVIELNNCIKYDFDKCNQCMVCIKTCPTRALTMFDGVIEFNNKKCYSCRKCINVCPTHSLYYNVNTASFEGKGSVAVIPYNADNRFLNKTYDKVVTYELAEKVKCVETAFEMERVSSKKINGEITKPLIITDVNNLEKYLIIKKSNVVNYLSRVKDVYTIAANLIKNNNQNISCISLYGVTFNAKAKLENNKNITEICDIPFKCVHKYNVLDILNTYISLCKFNCEVDIENLSFENDITIEVYNKYLKETILFTKNIYNLEYLNYSKYNFIFVVEDNKYILNNDLLKDDEINSLYKNIYKQPGTCTSFIKKE